MIQYNIDRLADVVDEVSLKTIESLYEESSYNFEAKFALSAKKKDNIIIFHPYVIKLKKRSIYEIEKTYYDIYIGNEILATDVSLFITVLKIIQKNKLDVESTGIENLLMLDKKYDMVLSDLILQREMISSTKNNEKLPIYKAKYDGMYMSLSRIKSQIMKIS